MGRRKSENQESEKKRRNRKGYGKARKEEIKDSVSESHSQQQV